MVKIVQTELSIQTSDEETTIGDSIVLKYRQADKTSSVHPDYRAKLLFSFSIHFILAEVVTPKLILPAYVPTGFEDTQDEDEYITPTGSKQRGN